MNNPGKDGMGRGRGRGMRRENQAERRDHRRPVDAGEKQLQDASSSNEFMQRGSGASVPPSVANAEPKSTSDLSKTSKLSADAKEFYPKGYLPQQDHNAQRGGEENSEVKCRIGELIASLTRDPGEFDRALTPLREKFVLWLQDPGAVHTMVDDIVEQSVVETNFRYNGARLCSFLYNLSGTIATSVFRSYLISRCTKLSSSRDDSQRSRSYGVAIFLAELFMQLEDGDGGSAGGGGRGRRIQALGEQLFSLLEKLIIQALTANAYAQNSKSPAPAAVAAENEGEGLKCVCQALKLAGWQLEEMNRSRMNRLSNDLAHAAGGLAGERGVRRIATAVGDLRRAGWGRRNLSFSGDATTMPSPSAPLQCRGVEGSSQWHGGGGRGRGYYNSNVDDPVFYGPDGQILTAEESNFLQDSTAAIYDDESGDGEWGDGWSDGGMDEEMEAAFEQFLQLGQKSTTA
ncbi:polyadenylate-binding protein-interacting protein 1 [Hetaerina americana]|uniref:polyadenylate-binding protein-interacting protein 1 n=1 Tax=Hetaerina americana TaxID=62018 RepID=UPI003A7F60C5